jgi:hypothetical protein
VRLCGLVERQNAYCIPVQNPSPVTDSISIRSNRENEIIVFILLRRHIVNRFRWKVQTAERTELEQRRIHAAVFLMEHLGIGNPGIGLIGLNPLRLKQSMLSFPRGFEYGFIKPGEQCGFFGQR